MKYSYVHGIIIKDIIHSKCENVLLRFLKSNNNKPVKNILFFIINLTLHFVTGMKKYSR